MIKPQITEEPAGFVWRESVLFWIVLGLVFILIGALFFDGIKTMVHDWSISEEYGYGFIVPFLSIFLIWQKKDELETLGFSGSWLGIGIILLGVAVFLLGYLATLYTVIQYGLVIVVVGLALSVVGWKGISMIWMPLLLLLFMIPLPAFLYRGISAELQLISSELGVWVIRLFGISVYLEGNVIDLGNYKLQVVEACSGLRYLFPLLTLSFISVYFFKAAFWKRVLVFLSSIPITVLMNSFRIGVIGVLVEYGGPEQAEGFLHDFEGWIVFMACIFILVAEMWLLTSFGKNKRPFSEVFGLELPEPTPDDVEKRIRPVPVQLGAALVLLFVAVIGSNTLGEREEIYPDRVAFSSFPINIDGWKGRQNSIEPIVLDALKLDDYVMTDYVNETGESINFYAAYYASQRSRASAHSPRACIPGGGWLIEDHSVVSLPDVELEGEELMINRLIIKKGDYVQLVYYWFQQRGRDITNEYLVKWYLFWDAMTRNRTDGAVVRITTNVGPGQDLSEAERKLQAFAKEAVPLLNGYIPD